MKLKNKIIITDGFDEYSSGINMIGFGAWAGMRLSVLDFFFPANSADPDQRAPTGAL